MRASALSSALVASVHASAADARHSYWFHRRALTGYMLKQLTTTVSPAIGGWTPLTPVVGPVSQLASEHVAPAPPPWLVELTSELNCAGHIPAAARAELTFMRYQASVGHVSPHRDRRSYIGLIVIVSLEGEAEFIIHGSRDVDDILAQWTVMPGDVVVMAGGPWRKGESGDGRPFHSVHAGRRERMSATIRFTLI